MEKITYDIDRKSLADRVYDHIKSLILSAELHGGEKIPEEAIASRFGISRTPVREALRRLDEYGLVNIKPRTYAEVVSLHPDEAKSVSRIRVAIELLIAETLVETGTEEDFNIISDAANVCDQAMSEGNMAKTFNTDSIFHLEMAKRTRDPHLYDIMEKLDSKVQLLRLVLKLPKDRVRYFVNQHQTIIKALRERDMNTAHNLIVNHIKGQLDIFETKVPLIEK